MSHVSLEEHMASAGQLSVSSDWVTIDQKLINLSRTQPFRSPVHPCG